MPDKKETRPDRDQDRLEDDQLEKIQGGTGQDLSQASGKPPTLPIGRGGN